MAVTFKVFRYDPDDGQAARTFQDYEVQNTKGMTILEGIYWIMENLDPTLAFRSACRAAICGSDAMHINGQYRLACKTQIDRHLRADSDPAPGASSGPERSRRRYAAVLRQLQDV